jgi:TatD DNase family protein
MFDGHLHFGSEPLYSQIATEAECAWKVGVRWAVNAPVDLESSRRALKINSNYPWILPCLGVHPQFLGAGPVPVDEFETLASGGGFVAVGEVGLDFWEGRTDEHRQREALHHFALIAKKHSLPLVIHARKALYEVLSELRRAEFAGGGLIHGFSGSYEMACAALDEGFCLGASTLLGRENKGGLREVFARVPRERVLVETDAPDMPPWPRRGSDHRPCELPGVVAGLARVWGAGVEETARITTENGLRLFGVSVSGEDF